MSAVYFVTYRGWFLKFTYQAGKRIYGFVDRSDATPFVDEPSAWCEAYQHGLGSIAQVVNGKDVKDAQKEAA